MKTYGAFKAAVRDMPNALIGTTCDDTAAIECQARRDCENPMAILRDLVRTELDLIEEGETDYGPQQRRWILFSLLRPERYRWCTTCHRNERLAI